MSCGIDIDHLFQQAASYAIVYCAEPHVIDRVPSCWAEGSSNVRFDSLNTP